MIEYGLGCIPDPLDSRDYLLSAYYPLAIEVPRKFSLRPKMTPVKNQGGLGSCVAFGVSAIKEYYDSAEYSKTVDLSEQYLYEECKKIDGFPNESGTTPRAAMIVLSKKGECEESYFPYEERYPAVNPPKPGADANAELYKIATYASVDGGIPGIKQALFQNGPISIAAQIYDSFYVSRDNGGFVPAPSGALHGGHCMCAIGYDDDLTWNGYKGFLEIRNSWGPTWGDQGNVWIPYTVYNSIQLSGTWSMVDTTNILKHWSDWPNQELNAQDTVWRSGLFFGYPDLTIRPWQNVLKRHVALIMERSGQTVLPEWKEDYGIASRGWVREQFPQLEWKEERWEEPITRYQLILLLARHIDSTHSKCYTV